MPIESRGQPQDDDLRTVVPASLQFQKALLWLRSVQLRLPGLLRRHRLGAGVVGAVLFFGFLSMARRSGSTARTYSPVVEGSPSLTFVAVGDWGRHGIPEQTSVASALASWVERVSSPFVISVGDNFYNDGVDSPSDTGFRDSFTAVYTASSLLRVPWYVVLGNHDYRGKYLQVGWQGEDAGTPGLLQGGRWTFPSPFYAAVYDMGTGAEVAGPRSRVPTSEFHRGSVPASSVSTPGACIGTIFVDTCPFIQYYRQPGFDKKEPQTAANIAAAVDPSVQLQWLKSSLQNITSVCSAVVVVGHHPLFSAGEHGDIKELIALFKPLFDKYGVDAYIAGHDHSMVHLVDRAEPAVGPSGHAPAGAQYIITGAGSEVRDTSKATPQTVFLQDKTPGFTVHSVNLT